MNEIEIDNMKRELAETKRLLSFRDEYIATLEKKNKHLQYHKFENKLPNKNTSEITESAIVLELKDKIRLLDGQNDRYYQAYTSAIGVIHYYLKKYPEEKRALNWLSDYVQSYYGEIKYQRD